MKKLFSFVCVLALLNCVACSDDSDVLPNTHIEITQEGAESYTLKGFDPSAGDVNYLKPQGFTNGVIVSNQNFVGKSTVFLADNANTLAEMSARPGEEAAWAEKAPVVKGHCYWLRNTAKFEYIFVKLRVAYILGNEVGVEYVMDGTEEHHLNDDANGNNEESGKFSKGLAIPALNEANAYVEHTVNANNAAILNYALEWNNEKRHAAWVAFTFDKFTAADNVKRTDDWNVDPLLKPEMQTSNDHHKNDGFDRGHLVASEDRVYSKEANQQTFFFSNMSPQLAFFNQQYWVKFEQKIQTWARSGVYDTLYVVKGGDLNHLLVNFTGKKKGADGKFPTTNEKGLTVHGLACPQYYYMAVLGVSAGKYQSLAFWVEHKEEYDAFEGEQTFKAHLVSIDELEDKTGVDFFCNLPDGQEAELEASYDASLWAW